MWIPKISGQGWIVITKDGGKDSSKPRLPEVCKRSKITYVVLSPKLGHQKVIIHQEALDEVMRNIAAIYKAPPGTGIKLERRVSKGGIKSYGLSVKAGKVWQSLGSFLTAIERTRRFVERGGMWSIAQAHGKGLGIDLKFHSAENTTLLIGSNARERGF